MDYHPAVPDDLTLPPRRINALAAIFAGLATMAAYLPALRNGFVNFWDDRATIIDNPMIRGLDAPHLRALFTTFLNGHYQPLSLLSLALDRRIWGDNPAGYHLTGALLHALNAALFCILIGRLLALSPRATGTVRWRPLAAAFGALVFSLHPLRVESVAWATERRDVLSGLFFLLAVLAYLPRAGCKARAFPWTALCWMAAGLLCKSILVTLPAVLLALDVFPLRRISLTGPTPAAGGNAGAGWRPVLIEKTPFLLLALPFMVIAHRAQQTSGAMSGSLWRGWHERFFLSVDALVFYVQKTLLPVNLSPLYALRPQGPDPLRVSVCIVLLLGAALWAWRMRGRHLWPLVAGFAYLALASPILGVFQSGPQRAADRYTYLALLPAAVLAAAGLEHALLRAVSRGGRTFWLAGALSLLVTMAGLTLRQISVWHDPAALWSRVLEIEPDSRVGRIFQAREGEFAEATARIEPLALAAERAPADVSIQSRLADALIEGRRCPEALGVLSRMLVLNPADATAFHRRGRCHEAAGGGENLAAAIRDYDQAVRLDPRDRASLLASALARQQRGDDAGAEPLFAQALVAEPGDWASRANHATSLMKLGRIPEAGREMRLAREQAPKWGQAMIDKQVADLDMQLSPSP
jgi:tetratricopeptide (TPR) repeat protein